MDIQSIKNRFGIIGNSPALNYALQVASQVANTDLTVLITGESGTGKEAFSQVIHALSARKHNPFIAVNCGAIPEGTIDSELFGHEKGSFTGAVDSRKGYFETVNGGTIFLDEIGEMPLGTQARLLRVLETGEFIRVGSSKVQKTDVRVIAATNKDLLEFTQKGKFREDLYYRLSTVPIRVPALRDRKEDISLLFRRFAVDFAEKYKASPLQLDEEAKDLLINYSWPGNVRELKNIAEQMSVLAQDKMVSGTEIRRFLPERDPNNRLPMLVSPTQSAAANGHEFANEREILYKLFFDMKKDVTELKKMFVEIIQNPGMAVQNQAAIINELKSKEILGGTGLIPHMQPATVNSPVQQVMIHHEDDIHHHEEVEESLNIMDKEKELIIKALKKHKGKRKDAATDLGISERTLYRKLKEYDIKE
ncbi:sigma-54-dependent Fis family transcriptional regulator [Pseudoflavitalea sp. G-6-1-2]|uniref:sigma-54 interaction domain-containing protein n=1 Tax=Pseudoflavitalea sp. G-6-1-2 TaxID=2728841 RepID=UPI00146C58DF|nr:sigma-54 dependent transcriptional regulator [Pseudoflavitalea sp. G-6-1-2]NML23656.1 sigma-54-dependent Fis family transcriptional regulator [Pseudoflavitalea sp. G-6-1-2]